MNILIFSVMLVWASTNAQSPCSTRDGSIGTCISLTSCPALYTVLRNRNRSPQDTKLLQDSKCGGRPGEVPSVCCPPQTVLPSVTDRTNSGSETLGAALLPKVCGQSDLESRVHGGNETTLGEYPWMALIEYRSRLFGDVRPYCGGALISSKYILTAGHCIIVDPSKTGPPLQVRLGEHDTTTLVDCRVVEGGGTDCNKAPITVPVASYAAHPQYNARDVRRRNDIGFIKMQRAVIFDDFVHPLCLPTTDDVSRTPVDQEYFVAGWGQTENMPRSTVKMDIKINMVDNAKCQRAYSGPKYGVQLWERQICAGGDEGIDSCGGDSGGPLMMNSAQRRRWEAVGIVSFGPTDCGTKGIPGIYTKVFDYRPWLLSQLTA